MDRPSRCGTEPPPSRDLAEYEARLDDGLEPDISRDELAALEWWAEGSPLCW